MTLEQLKENDRRQDRAIRSMERKLSRMMGWIESQKKKDKKIKK